MTVSRFQLRANPAVPLASGEDTIDVFSVDTYASLPTAHSAGDLAFIEDTGELLRSNGTYFVSPKGDLAGWHAIVDNTAKPLFTVTVGGSDTAWAGIIEYAVFYADASHVVQLDVGQLPIGAINENGTVTAIVGALRTLAGEVTSVAGTPMDGAIDVGGGTNVVTVEATQATTVATFKIKANTSLTAAAGKAKCYWRVKPITVGSAGGGSSPVAATGVIAAAAA